MLQMEGNQLEKEALEQRDNEMKARMAIQEWSVEDRRRKAEAEMRRPAFERLPIFPAGMSEERLGCLGNVMFTLN